MGSVTVDLTVSVDGFIAGSGDGRMANGARASRS
jgi:hypothetical protein